MSTQTVLASGLRYGKTRRFELLRLAALLERPLR